jgi:hypothetical protein
MLKIHYTNEMVFGFDGPNLCLLGTEDDYLKLAKSIVDLTGVDESKPINLLELDFTFKDGEDKQIFFSSKIGGKSLGVFEPSGNLIFQLDRRYWDRLFKYFILMSWSKATYYLNHYENCLNDLGLEQECNFICISKF